MYVTTGLSSCFQCSLGRNWSLRVGKVFYFISLHLLILPLASHAMWIGNRNPLALAKGHLKEYSQTSPL